MGDKSSRTEKATPKKLREARKKGQLPRSKELGQSVTLFLTIIVLAIFGQSALTALLGTFRLLFTQAFSIKEGIPFIAIRDSFFVVVFYIMTPFLIILSIIAFIGGNLQGGFNISSEPLKFNADKLNPVEGFKRLFSTQSLFTLLKNILMISVLSWICYATFRSEVGTLPMLIIASLHDILAKLKDGLWTISFRFTIFLLFVSALDLAFVKYKFQKDMMMTKQEVKDDIKDTEGNPQVKGRIRKTMMKIAFSRMMQEVPNATAVITNPTHYAVALKYEPVLMSAPFVVAKGKGHIALKIKEIAKKNDIPIVEDKPLAQALYKSSEIGKSIPPNLFKAVAQILAYLYRTGKWKHTFNL